MRKKSVLLWGLSVLFTLIIIIQSPSFIVRNWPDVGVPAHHAIVRDAMQLIGDFPQDALDRLMFGAEIPDGVPAGNPLNKWDKWAHFLTDPDFPYEDTFGEVWDLVAGSREDLLESAVDHAASPLTEEVHACFHALGEHSHTIADFYAHTNWVEQVVPLLTTVNFLAADPPAGCYSGGGVKSKDSPGNSNFREAYDDAVLSTIWYWYRFEDRMIETYGSSNAFYYINNNLQIPPAVKMYFPPHDTHIYAWDYIAPGYNRGVVQKLKWNHSAIPHDATVRLKLWKDDSICIGDITPTDVPADTKEFYWNVGYCAGGVIAEYDNYSPHYDIEIIATTPTGTVSDKSIHFYILNPLTGTAQYLAADSSAWNDIQLTWADVSSSETGYAVYRRKTSDPDFSILKTVGPNVTTTHDTTALADNIYYYRVRTLFPGGTYATTNEAFAQVQTIPPDPPSLINVWYEPNKGRFKLAWNNTSANEQGFKIERRYEWEPNFYEIATVGPNGSYYYDYDLQENPGGYANVIYYRIKAYNPAGFVYSDVVDLIFQ